MDDWYLHAFAKRGARVTGIDLSDLLIENARKRFRNRQFDAKFVQGDMREFPFQNEFDGATRSIIKKSVQQAIRQPKPNKSVINSFIISVNFNSVCLCIEQ
jgi:ubiquinone/menaquinone biosynthesis C-methylase UbiE